MTTSEQIEVLRELIETRETAVVIRGGDNTISKAKDWLAELEREKAYITRLALSQMKIL